MLELDNQYLRDLAEQLAYLSTFLGGFAATFLATLLVANSSHRVNNWVVSLSAISACGFIVATICFIMISVVIHPNGPNNGPSTDFINAARLISSLGLMTGLLMLIISIGLSGWLRSRIVGVTSSTAAGAALLVILWAVTQ